MSADVIPVAREFNGEDDLSRLVAMLQAVVAADRGGLTVSEADLRFEWIDDEPGWIRQLRVWEVGERFVASFGAWHEVADQLGRAYSELDIHPEWREPVFVDEVVWAMMDAVAELIERPVEHRLGGPSGQDWRREGLERAGYTFDRVYNRMIATLSETMPGPNLPDEFAIRPFAGEHEIEDWVSVFNNGFATHHDPPTTNVAEKRHRMEEAGYMADADLVLNDSAGAMVGLARNSREIVDNGDDLGWVNSIVILPEYRGQGLGRALLQASMRALFDAGFERAILTVDTGNQTGAAHLYESVGFRIDHQFIQHVRVIEPAAP